MMALYSKVVSGKISVEDLMEMLEETQSTTGSTTLVSTATEGNSDTSGGVPWTDYDTAGTGEKTTTQSSSTSTQVASSDDDSNTTTQASNTNGSDTNTNTDTSTSNTNGSDTSNNSSTSMTREEAIKRMQEMLRRLANKK
jgi:hypothetical protein